MCSPFVFKDRLVASTEKGLFFIYKNIKARLNVFHYIANNLTHLVIIQYLSINHKLEGSMHLLLKHLDFISNRCDIYSVYTYIDKDS